MSDHDEHVFTYPSTAMRSLRGVVAVLSFVGCGHFGSSETSKAQLVYESTGMYIQYIPVYKYRRPRYGIYWYVPKVELL